MLALSTLACLPTIDPLDREESELATLAEEEVEEDGEREELPREEDAAVDTGDTGGIEEVGEERLTSGRSCATWIEENGDLSFDLGEADPPEVVCGALAEVGHDEHDNYTGDYDIFVFEVAAGAWAVGMETLAEGADYDLFVVEERDGDYELLAYSATNAGYEELDLEVGASRLHVGVVGYEGAAGNWIVVLDEG